MEFSKRADAMLELKGQLQVVRALGADSEEEEQSLLENTLQQIMLSFVPAACTSTAPSQMDYHHDPLLLPLLLATQLGHVVKVLCKHPGPRVAALAQGIVASWRQHILQDDAHKQQQAGCEQEIKAHNSANMTAVVAEETASSNKKAGHGPSRLKAQKEININIKDMQTRPQKDLISSTSASCLPISTGHKKAVETTRNSAETTSLFQSDRLEVSKHKLQQAYQREREAKRQHTICVLPPSQLPPPVQASSASVAASIRKHREQISSCASHHINLERRLRDFKTQNHARRPVTQHSRLHTRPAVVL